jgi:hypothetical protein
MIVGPPPSRARRAAAVSAVLVAPVAVLGLQVPGVSAKVAVTRSSKVLTIQDSRIDESSGLVRSNLSSSRLWTVNDSGGGTTVYALDMSGRTTATYELTNASHKDWEGMASTVIGGTSYIYVGDIGDNGKKRSSIFVHRFVEPSGSTGGALPYVTYELAYPDGARNAEGMMVDPTTHRLYVVSKVKKANGAIYAAPTTLSTTSVNRMTKVATAPAGMSDAVFLADGRFVLRGYVNGWLYSKIGATPVGFSLPLKGESISQDWSGGDVLIGSEKVRSPIYRVSLP